MIVCLGEALIDLMPADTAGELWAARPGGAPMNVAIAAARLAAPAAFVGHLSTDRFGDLLRRHLDDSGVDRSRCRSSDAATTLAIVDPGGADREPGFTFHAADTTAVTLDAADIDLAGATFVHLSGSVSAVLEPAATAFADLLTRGGDAVVAVDPNPRPHIVGSREAFAARLDGWIGHADLVKVSRADLQWIEPAVDPADVAQRWLDRGVVAVVVTKGGDGAEVLTAGGSVAVPARAATIVDTVGAGDTFMGGVLTRLHELGVCDAASLAAVTTDQWSEVLDFAGRAAAIACGRVGADPPRRHELTD